MRRTSACENLEGTNSRQQRKQLERAEWIGGKKRQMHGAGGGHPQPRLKARGGEVRRNRLESQAEVDRSVGWYRGLWDRTWAGMSLPMTLESLPLGKLTCTHGPKQAVRAPGRGAVKQA